MVLTRSKTSNSSDSEFVFLGPKKLFRPMIAASYTRNHIYGFKENDIQKILNKQQFSPSQKGMITINSFRKKRGLEFEKRIFDMWEKDDTILLKSYNDMKWTLVNCQSSKKDINEQKYHLLKHIPLINPYNRVGGIPDILIRSDRIREILNMDYPFVNDRVHYVLLEIKYSSTISKYHRNQLYCYNNALKHIQNYEPKCAFVLNKTKKIEMIIFNQDDKDRYETSTDWYRKIKKIKLDSITNTRIDKMMIYKKLKFVPKIRIPKIKIPNYILAPKQILDKTKRFVYYLFVLDIDISAFFITEITSIIWHVSMVRIDRHNPELPPIFIRYTGSTFSPVETYKSVNFIYHNLVPNSEIIFCSKISKDWDWFDPQWKNGNSQLGNILENKNILNIDKIVVLAWQYINSKDLSLLIRIENNSRIYLNEALNKIC